MTGARIPGPGEWPIWTLVESERLEVAQDERPFLETAAGLVAEFGELASLLARAAPPGGRDAAILCGLAVRIVKLTRRIAAETYEDRGDLQLLLDREIFASVAAMAYLLRGGGERFEAYVRDGLRADYAVWRHLDANRERRGGEALPLERRMRERLARSFGLAGLPPGADPGDAGGGGDGPDGGGAPAWPPLGDQLRAIGEPDAHRMHQLGADAIHGLWNELHTHHLRDAAGGLGPKLEWSPAKVQPLTAVAIQASRVMAAWSRRLGHEAADAFRDKFLDIAGRAALVDRLHEEYLARALRPGPDGGGSVAG